MTRAIISSGCGRLSCASKKTSGDGRLPSWSTACRSSPRAPTGSRRIPSPPGLRDEVLEGLIRSAAETHQNMLRVWGGGFYEDERFYDLCDRYGILVWQEFIFSCSVYPLDDPEFLENVHQEADPEHPPTSPSCQPGVVVWKQRDGMGLGGLELEPPRATGFERLPTTSFSTTRCRNGARLRTRTIPIGPAHPLRILRSRIRTVSAREMLIIGTSGMGENPLLLTATNTRAS